MRCVYLITGLAYGGAENQAVQLAMRLKARGWDIVMVSALRPQAYVEDLQAAGIPLYSLGIRRGVPDPRAISRFARILKKERPEIVHAHMIHANLLARITRLFIPVPVLICTAHNVEEKGRIGSLRIREMAYRATDWLCDLTTHVCRTGVERYIAEKVVPAHKIRYIPNGLDVHHFYSDPKVRRWVREDLELGNDFVWIAVGRFDPQKNYRCMLEAFARVMQRKHRVRLVIVGNGSLRPTMEQFAEERGISEKVRFLGIRKNVPHLMQAADALVMSSDWEGLPMVLLEAHASSLPVVATDVGGNREVVRDGETGFLVPPRDPEALAQAMLRLMDLPEEERQKMGMVARQHIEANFSLDRVVDQWEAVYRELWRNRAVRAKEGY